MSPPPPLFEGRQTKSSTSDLVSLRTGIAWNVAALGFLAIAGVALNLIIGMFYTPDILGLFNVIFAIFILTSQLATFGLQLATLQAVSNHWEDMSAISLSLRSAFISATMINMIVVPLAFIAAPLIADFYDQIDNIAKAWIIALPGLFFFSINKIQLAAINGMRHMRAFASFQAIRFLLILALLVGMVWQGVEGWVLPGVLSGAEILLCPCLMLYLRRSGALIRPTETLRPTVIKRLQFGARVFAAGTLAELNTRVDILMLGIYVTAADIGVYSVAILIFDAAGQLIHVVRNNINPSVATNVASRQFSTMLTISRKIAASFFFLYILAACALWLVFPYVIGFIFPDPIYVGAKEPATILIVALALAGGGMAFNMTLSQSNRPGWQSLFVLIVVTINIIANALLIPHFGIVGAALGTLTALLASACLTIFLSRWLTGLRIIL